MIKARELHKKMITIDTHLDFQGDTGILDKMIAGGMDAAFFAVYTEQAKLSDESYAKAYYGAVEHFAIIRNMCDKYPDKVQLALTPDDVKRIKKTGKRIALIGIENGFPIGKDIENLRYFYSLGGRYMSVTHMGFNQLADSSNPLGDVPASNYGGLSDLGKEVIREMNRLGMLIDISHTGPKTVVGHSRSHKSACYRIPFRLPRTM